MEQTNFSDLSSQISQTLDITPKKMKTTNSKSFLYFGRFRYFPRKLKYLTKNFQLNCYCIPWSHLTYISIVTSVLWNKESFFSLSISRFFVQDVFNSFEKHRVRFSLLTKIKKSIWPDRTFQPERELGLPHYFSPLMVYQLINHLIDSFICHDCQILWYSHLPCHL